MVNGNTKYPSQLKSYLRGENKNNHGSFSILIKVMAFNKANLRDLIAATGLVISNWIQIINFSARVTVKFEGWPQTRQIWGIWKLRLAYSPETPNLGQNRWCLSTSTEIDRVITGFYCIVFCEFENYTFKITAASLRSQWVKGWQNLHFLTYRSLPFWHSPTEACHFGSHQ